MVQFRISQLARRAGLRSSALRYYEREGLLPSRRSPNGYRVYDESVLDRLAFIAAGKRLGLPLTEIRDLLTVWRDGMCTDVRRELRPMLRARIADARARATELEMFTRVLGEALAEIDGPERPGRCDPDCEVLQPRSTPEAPILSATASPTSTATAEPVECTLDGAGVRERVYAWSDLLAEAVSREAIDGGVRVVFSVARAGQVAEIVAAEQRCCRVLRFDLRFAHELVELQVRAPAEAMPLVAEVFDPTADVLATASAAPVTRDPTAAGGSVSAGVEVS